MFGMRKFAAAGAAAVVIAGLGTAGTAVAAPVASQSPSLASCDLYVGQPYHSLDGKVWVQGGGNNCGGAVDQICVWLQYNSLGNVYTQDIQCRPVGQYDNTWGASSAYTPGMWGGMAIAMKNGAYVQTVQNGAWL
ncbi:hypothetical protein ACIRYZ_27745 [Kitasatospora sp. NPDC101155]|uniref:hypothetical protein n=1 Tax=Kitasatospora sp. NPDC101155 TaxID=3364097 RepID=UPI0038125D9F